MIQTDFGFMSGHPKIPAAFGKSSEKPALQTLKPDSELVLCGDDVKIVKLHHQGLARLGRITVINNTFKGCGHEDFSAA
jgi:hypothetical protein